MELTKEQLCELHRRLPEDLREAIASVDDIDILIQLYQEHALHIDQLSLLSEAVGKTLFGLIRPEDFRAYIKDKLQLSDEKAETITARVNKEIFEPVRESLKLAQKIRNQYATESAEHDTITPTPAATASPAPAGNVFVNKMGSVFNIPSEQKKITDPYREEPR